METRKKKSTSVGYEYKDITVDRELENLYVDGYANFGWQQEGTTYARSPRTIVLKFKRNRQLGAKAELTRLQRKFEALLENISAMEESKTSRATVLAFCIGLMGTGLLAGSVFALLSGALPLCILLAISGLIGWVAAYLSYTQLRSKKAAQIDPRIEEQYAEIYKTCERANALLTA